MLPILLVLAVDPLPPAAPVPTPAATVLAPQPSPDGFTIGVDTIATVQAKLGKPKALVHNSDGTTKFVYLSSRTRVKGATFVPVIGLFAGGAKSHLSTKTFTFDGAGLLKTYTSSDADANCNTSIVGARCE